jgi:ribosomal protein L32
MSIWATHCSECGKLYLAGSFCYDCENKEAVK